MSTAAATNVVLVHGGFIPQRDGRFPELDYGTATVAGLLQAHLPASAVATNVHRFGHAALGLGWPQRCWRSLRMRARSRRWAARTSGWRA